MAWFTVGFPVFHELTGVRLFVTVCTDRCDVDVSHRSCFDVALGAFDGLVFAFEGKFCLGMVEEEVRPGLCRVACFAPARAAIELTTVVILVTLRARDRPCPTELPRAFCPDGVCEMTCGTWGRLVCPCESKP